MRRSRRCWSRRGSPPRSTTTSWKTSTSSPARVRLARLRPRRRNRSPRNWPAATALLLDPRSASARRSARWEKGESVSFYPAFVSWFLWNRTTVIFWFWGSWNRQISVIFWISVSTVSILNSWCISCKQRKDSSCCSARCTFINSFFSK